MGAQDLRERMEKAVAVLREEPLYILGAAVLVLLVLFFWQALLFTAITLVAGAAIILVVAKLYFRKPGLKSLFREKKRLLNEIGIAEKRYMKRKMSEVDFGKLFKEKQRQLISLEAEIDKQYNRERQVEISQELQAVQAKKRHILQSLLEEKRKIIKELGIAERRYLKRKLDVKTYQALVQKNQGRLISLEAQIKGLYSEANIQKVMDSLKDRLEAVEKGKRKRKKKGKKSEREKELQIAAEIAEQLIGRG